MFRKLAVYFFNAYVFKGAIPCKLPGCPQYLSKDESVHREDPATRRLKNENKTLQKAIAESLVTSSAYAEENSLATLDEVYLKCAKKEFGDWILIKTIKKNISFIYMEETQQPSVQCVVFITEGLSLSVFYHNIEIKKIDNLKFPLTVNNVNTLEETLKEIQQFILKKNEDHTTVNESCSLIVDILHSLSQKLPEKNHSIKFMQEQIKLLNTSSKNALRYSCETMLFCSLLHAISPHAYKFLRNSNHVVLPCSSTIKKNVCQLCH